MGRIRHALRTVRFYVFTRLLLFQAAPLAAALTVLAGCSSTRDWNPFVDLSDYDVIVVQDFQDGGLGIGRALSDQLASELMRRGAFAQVLRQRSGERSIVVSGVIERFKEGNVAQRIKFGTGTGEAHLALALRVSVDPRFEYVGEFAVNESTLQTGPDARRTGREDASWLRQQAVKRMAGILLEQRAKR